MPLSSRCHDWMQIGHDNGCLQNGLSAALTTIYDTGHDNRVSVTLFAVASVGPSKSCNCYVDSTAIRLPFGPARSPLDQKVRTLSNRCVLAPKCIGRAEYNLQKDQIRGAEGIEFQYMLLLNFISILSLEPPDVSK